MIQTFNKGKVVLDTIAQFQTLSTTGALVIDGVTITYDPDHYDYWVKEKDYYTQTEVVANPTSAGTVDLTKLKIGDTVYNIPSGGGGGSLYLHMVSVDYMDMSDYTNTVLHLKYITSDANAYSNFADLVDKQYLLIYGSGDRDGTISVVNEFVYNDALQKWVAITLSAGQWEFDPQNPTFGMSDVVIEL